MKPNEFLEMLREALIGIMEARAIPREKALEIADELIVRIRAHFGTERVYIPAPNKAQRNHRIIAEWDAGVPTEVIARRVGVHQSTVRRVISTHLQDKQSLAPPDWHL